MLTINNLNFKVYHAKSDIIGSCPEYFENVDFLIYEFRGICYLVLRKDIPKRLFEKQTTMRISQLHKIASKISNANEIFRLVLNTIGVN